MGINNNGNSPLFGFSLSERIRKLRFRNKSLFKADSLKRIVGILSIISAVLIGFWAQEFSKKEALLDWEKTNFPSKTIWKHALESRGFQNVVEQKIINKVIRNLPVSFDEKGSVWRDSTNNWIAVFADPGNPDSVDLYTVIPVENFINKKGDKTTISGKIQSQLPGQWEPSGQGWKTFERILSDLDRLHPDPKKQTVKANIKPRIRYRDPREIQY